MANRTFKFYGQGWGPSPAQITVTFNGQNIFSGAIPTVPDRPPTGPGFFTPVYLFTGGELDVAASGSFSLTVTVDQGNLVLSDLTSNYVPVPNPVFTPEQFAVLQQGTDSAQISQICYSMANPPFTDEEKQMLDSLPTDAASAQIVDQARADHNVSTFVSGADYFSPDFWPEDSRKNVVIDGEPQNVPDPRPDGLIGDWNWRILEGQVLTCEVDVLPGTV